MNIKKQLFKIEKNAKNIMNPEMLFIINKRYRELTEQLKQQK